MAACPHCLFENVERVALCAGCGRTLTGPGGTSIAVPLPARMTEPIRTPPKPPADDGPLANRLGVKSVAVAAAKPSAPTRTDAENSEQAFHDLPADDFLTHDGLPPGGTVPAHPGLPGHPMNDAALQNPLHTVPATDMADHEAHPLPQAPAARPKFVVLRGLKVNAEYLIYEGRNTIGRFADRPVDIDLVSQESIEQIWCSRQHAVVTLDRGVVAVEDMNSLNGTWVNGTRIHPGHYLALNHGDVVQVGTVQLKLVLG